MSTTISHFSLFPFKHFSFPILKSISYWIYCELAQFLNWDWISTASSINLGHFNASMSCFFFLCKSVLPRTLNHTFVVLAQSTLIGKHYANTLSIPCHTYHSTSTVPCSFQTSGVSADLVALRCPKFYHTIGSWASNSFPTGKCLRVVYLQNDFMQYQLP